MVWRKLEGMWRKEGGEGGLEKVGGTLGDTLHPHTHIRRL